MGHLRVIRSGLIRSGGCAARPGGGRWGSYRGALDRGAGTAARGSRRPPGRTAPAGTIMARVATASLAETPQQHVGVNRPNMVQVGTIVWLASELMFFAGLFAMYFTIRTVAPQEWVTEPEKLNIPFSLTNTINLVLSSVWCQMGVFAAERYQASALGPWWTPWSRQHGWRNWGMREWYTLTYVAGALFIAGQVFEYASLVREGLTISAN